MPNDLGACNILPQKSCWEICKQTTYKMYEKGSLGKVIALAMGALALSMLTIYFSVKAPGMLKDAHQKLAEGNWVIETYRYGILLHSRPFSQIDVVTMYLGVILVWPLLVLFSCALFSGCVEEIARAYREAIR